MGWGSSFIWTAIRSSFSRDVPFFMIFFICTPTLAKDDGIPIGEFGRVFLQRSWKKFWPIAQLFPRCQQRTKPSDFIFQCAPTKLWGFEFQSSLWEEGGGAGEGGVDKNWKMKNPKPVTIQFPVEWTCLMIINKFQVLWTRRFRWLSKDINLWRAS